MTDAPPSPEPTPAPGFGQGQEIEVDLAAFLPDGTELADQEPEAAVATAAPAVDLEALSQIERDLDAVDAAIAALDAGTYGVDASGAPIDDARLATDPTCLS